MGKPTTVSFCYPAGKEDMPIGPYAKAGVLVDINAGWRTARPIVDQSKCTKCLKCWLICPDGAIGRTAEGYVVDLDFCKGCGLCAYECRAGAIAMVKEGEAKIA
jgi:pyruvate ferredoxin oxidoreductase delta subunit